MTPDEIQKDHEAGTPTRDEIANGMNCQTSGWAFDCYPIRFLPYKPDGRRQMGKRGRWQRMNEYGGWENCADPTQILADCVNPVTLTAERERKLVEALKKAARALDWAARQMKGNCTGSAVNATMLAAGNATAVREELGYE